MKKVLLDNLTIVIPVKMDSLDRMYNLNIVLDYITSNFDVRIIVGVDESYPILNNLYRKYNCKYYWFNEDKDYFNRTKLINYLIKMSLTKYVMHWDCDILIPKEQIIQSLNIIRNETGLSLVYPYDGQWYNLPLDIKKYFNDGNIDFDFLKSLRQYESFTDSVGGCCLINKNDHIKYGGRCEYIKSWGGEDKEYFYRYSKIGFNIEKVKGPCFHIDHYRGKDSHWNDNINKYASSNLNYVKEVKNMSLDETIETIAKFPWLCLSNKPFKNIIVTSINSGKNAKNDFFNCLKTQIDTLHKLSYDLYDMQYIYDLGITENEKTYLNSISKVTVVNYPEEHKNYYEEFLSPLYYGFKISAINDVNKYGENIFWLDSGVCVIKDIKCIFDIINKNHIFLVEDNNNVNRDWTNSLCCNIMGASEKELNGYQLSAGILGYKHNGNYQYFMDEVFNFAKIKDCLVGDISNHRHDQSIYSILKERFSIPAHPRDIYGEYRGILNSDQVLYVHRGLYRTDFSNIRRYK